MVLEVIEEQVRRGSRIYEKDHYVVLVWGNSQVRPGNMAATQDEVERVVDHRAAANKATT